MNTYCFLILGENLRIHFTLIITTFHLNIAKGNKILFSFYIQFLQFHYYQWDMFFREKNDTRVLKISHKLESKCCHIYTVEDF